MDFFESEVNGVDPLTVATRVYYWKPMAALFRSIELRRYCESGIEVDGMVLDLCCGDGQVISMLRQLRVVTGQVCGVEMSMNEISKSSKSQTHKWVLQASANHLPFKDGSFSFIVGNGALSSIRGGVGCSLSEVYRTLKNGASFVVTVPTDKFIDVLLVPKILGMVSSNLRARYIRGISHRLPLYNISGSKGWMQRFGNAGFSVLRMEEFFSVKTGYLWSLFAMQVVRILGFLKYCRIRCVEIVMSRLLQRVCAPSYSNDRNDPNADFGYLFILAKKKAVK